MYKANSSFSKNMVKAVKMTFSVIFKPTVLGRKSNRLNLSARRLGPTMSRPRPVPPRSSSSTCCTVVSMCPSLIEDVTVLQSSPAMVEVAAEVSAEVVEVAVSHRSVVSSSQSIASTEAADWSVAMAEEAVAMAEDAVAMAVEAVAIAEEAVAMAEEALATAEETVSAVGGGAVVSAVNTSSTGHNTMSPEEREHFPSVHYL
ncbi:unnamed protein product [Macrosiphum euphorbiae]|uniref:Uncharacterized protein n=1 Tax=Macrosiphum euphorbiae TaxID=13131 RepID=A0AAV0WVL9_9HEMI|nr:unnamed protein product [Macrosiphum euphorbiae]